MDISISPPPTTIFERQSRLAQELGAINLGQGFPDGMAEPAELLEAAARALTGNSNQYPPMRGLPALREAIISYCVRQYGLALSLDEVIVTSGGTEALAASLLALIQPGDEVVLVQPLYDAYLPLVERAGGIARFIALSPPDWAFPIEELEKSINERTRVLVLNSPNNPTGTCITATEWQAIAAVCVRHDLTLVCDEVWEAMVYEDRHITALAIDGLRERTVKIGSAGKVFSLTGWKVGWICAAPALAQKIAAVHQFLTFTTATPLQWAVAEGMKLPEAWHESHRARYAHARGFLASRLRDAGYAVQRNRATWFLILDLAASGIAMSDEAFCQRLIMEAGVASIPVSAFYAHNPQTGFVRLCFTKGEDTLAQAAQRLIDFRQKIL